MKYAYFGGFIDSRQVSQFLFLKKGEFRQMLVRWVRRDPGKRLLAVLYQVALIKVKISKIVGAQFIAPRRA